MSGWTNPPRLQAGERVRFEDGSTYRVERVTACSATLVPELRTPRVVTVHDKEGNERTFEAHAGGGRLQVSPYAFVERVS